MKGSRPHLLLCLSLVGQFAKVWEDEEIAIEADPDRLVDRVQREFFDCVVIDVTQPGLTLSKVRQVAELVPRTFMASTPFITELARKLVEQHPSSPDLTGLSTGHSPVAGSGSRLVRARSEQEANDLRRRALEVAFAERGKTLDGSFTTQQVADLLRVSRQTPHDRVRAKTLLGLEDNGALRFPLWQFDADGPAGVVAGLPEVLRALEVSDFAQARWLRRPNPVLAGLTPIDALRAGELERVVTEARGVGAHAGAARG